MAVGAVQSSKEVVQEEEGKGEEPSTEPDKDHFGHGQQRRPAVTGACALSAVSAVTTR
jgi:hypothetical protein